MLKPYLEYLRHILIEINFIIEQTNGLEQGEFMSDEVMKRAIVRSIEIIGEAVKRLPVRLREQHSEIDWRGIAGTRDKLIHNYLGIDYEIVWDIVLHEIPPLKEQIENILSEEGNS